MKIEIRYINVKNKINEDVELEFIILRGKKEANILVSFIDNDNFLFRIAKLTVDDEDLGESINSTLNYMTKNKEELYSLLNIINDYEFYKKNLNNIEFVNNHVMKGLLL